jgi:hypothetical protein
MVISRFIFLALLCLPLHLRSAEANNILMYEGGDVQVTSELNNQYQNIAVNSPITGTVMVTHDANTPIDAKSFRLGSKPLKVSFVQSVPMSSFSNLVITIYKFEIEGRKMGIYTLDPINVKVGSKE